VFLKPITSFRDALLRANPESRAALRSGFRINPKTGKRRNLGTFKSRTAAEKHERDVQYFKRH
jgi:hypothetical protein